MPTPGVGRITPPADVYKRQLVEQCCRRAVEQRRELRAVLGEEARVSAELSGDELDRLLDPAHYLGQARAWVERALAEHHALGFEPHPA